MNEEREGVSPTPFYLHKIYSIKKQLQVFDILQAIHPTHAERLWLAGFLKYAGYSYEEVVKIIEEHCQWEDYSPAITQYQVSSVFHQPHRASTGNAGKRRTRKWDLTPTQAYRCKYYRTLAKNRELERFARQNGGAICDACPELPFSPGLIGGFEK